MQSLVMIQFIPEDFGAAGFKLFSLGARAPAPSPGHQNAFTPLCHASATAYRRSAQPVSNVLFVAFSSAASAILPQQPTPAQRPLIMRQSPSRRISEADSGEQVGHIARRATMLRDS